MEIAKAKADAATKIAMAKAKEVSSKEAAEEKVMREIEAKMNPKKSDDDDDDAPKTWSLSADPIDGRRSDDDVDNFVEQAEKAGAHVSKEDKETLEEAQRERMVAEEQLIEAKMEAAKVADAAAEAAAEAKKEAQAEIDAAKAETEKAKASAAALLIHQQSTENEKLNLEADLENEKSKEQDIAREAATEALREEQQATSTSESTTATATTTSSTEPVTTAAATVLAETETTTTTVSADNAVVDDEKLPEPWKAVLDSDSGKTYYWNTETQETSWDKPSK